jgi:hypothetical protein
MSHLEKQQTKLANTNISQGDYRSHFFDLSSFDISEVNFSSIFFENNNSNVELSLLREDFSFAYLREDKLRTIDVFDTGESKHLSFKDFLDKFSIKINSNNLFKTGKYLSRVFRPVRYGGFYKDLNINVNRNPEYTGAITDGISLISFDLAKSLGWKNAKPNMSGQFTLFYEEGLVKGHCVISDKIISDVIIYGEENIKKEISFQSGLQYVTLEPVKLSKSLRLDIQSLLNLWNLFGAEQYLEWAYDGIEEYKSLLKEGKLNDWLDNFDDITVDDYNNESWILRKAIWHKIDYRRFPGLVRLAWGMFRSSILRYAESVEGNPVFRIPVPGGMRGYIRIDLRDHDPNGDFDTSNNKQSIEVDEYGNVWFTAYEIEKRLKILGGADMDDAVGIIPIQEGKSVIYRNPNQYGEYLSTDTKFFSRVKENVVIGNVPQKRVKITTAQKIIDEAKNKLYNNIHFRKVSVLSIDYSVKNLLKRYTSISSNSASIGIAANGEMIKSAIRIENPKAFELLNKYFIWDLERIIDSTVKDGVSCSDDMKAIRNMYSFIIINNIKLPKSIIHRLPNRLQESAKISEGHLLDELLEAIKMLITKADREIVGSGSVKKGNRIERWVDSLNILLIELGMANLGNEKNKKAKVLLKKYNKQIAILLEKTKNLQRADKMKEIKEKVESIQSDYLVELSKYTSEERYKIILSISYEIYKSSSSVHDSILWINDKNSANGTALDMIEILSKIGEAFTVKENGNVQREEIRPQKE